MDIRIPVSVPSVGEQEQRSVAAAISGGWIAPVGPDLRRFEEALAERTGRSRAVAVASGTAALHLQLLAAGIGPGDRVVCPTLTFVATANAIAYTGATTVLIDCDETGNLDPDLLRQLLQEQEADGTPITAVLPVDLYGKVADHDRIGRLAALNGAQLLVDAAESLGARRSGQPAGSHGRAAAVSFNGNKIITASSGGAVLTDDEELADRVLFLSTQAREPLPHYLHRETGYNYRLSNILAALGHAQLQRLDEFLAARRGHRERYHRLAAEVPGLSILGGHGPAADAEDNCWLTAVVLEPGAGSVSHLARELGEHGVETRRLFTPLHTQPLFADHRRTPRLLDGTAQRLFETALVVPSSPASSAADIELVCTLIARSLDRQSAEGALVP